MARYLVGADPAVIAELAAHLQKMPGRFSVIPNTGSPAHQTPDRLVVETTPEGAQQLQMVLAGIGVVEPDLPINPTS